MTGQPLTVVRGREPLEFEVGSGAVIPGFDEGVTGMVAGEKKTINIPVDEAYGACAGGDDHGNFLSANFLMI